MSSPLFPFGFGLSYSERRLVGPLRVSSVPPAAPASATAAAAAAASAPVLLVNASLCTHSGPGGAATAQLYAQDPAGGALVRPYAEM